MEVLGTLLSLPAMVGNSATDSTLSDPPDQIISAVLLTGPRLSGTVQVQLPKDFVKFAFCRLTGTDAASADTNGLLDDTAGELANMVAGRVAAQLTVGGYPCTLGTPLVSRSAPLPIEPQAGAERGRTDLICEGHRLAVEIQCHYALLTPRILSIDDSKTIRLSLARLFRPFACHWLEAANGEEGLALAIREQPDLILLDYNMPVMDGIAMLHKLREHAELRRTPVIMLTAESGPEQLATVARLGVRDYVTKPFREEDLLSKVGRIIPLIPRADT